MQGSAPAIPDAAISLRTLAPGSDLGSLRIAPISVWFDPFLVHFMREALRCEGDVVVAEEDGWITGVYLFSRSENVGSVFGRARPVLDALYARQDHCQVFSELKLDPKAEPLEVYAADLRDWAADHRLRTRVRTAGPGDLSTVESLLHEVNGSVDHAWFRSLPGGEETCMVAELEGKVVGSGWVSREGPFGRVHSLAVRPQVRGLGIGKDLLFARMLWLKEMGARQVISEIFADNFASKGVAERLGMAPVAEIYLNRRA